MQIMPLFQMGLLRLLLFCLLFHWAILEILLEVYQEQIIHLLERYTIKLFTKFINTNALHNDRKSRKQVWLQKTIVSLFVHCSYVCLYSYHLCLLCWWIYSLPWWVIHILGLQKSKMSGCDRWNYIVQLFIIKSYYIYIFFTKKNHMF